MKVITLIVHREKFSIYKQSNLWYHELRDKYDFFIESITIFVFPYYHELHYAFTSETSLGVSSLITWVFVAGKFYLCTILLFVNTEIRQFPFRVSNVYIQFIQPLI